MKKIVLAMAAFAFSFGVMSAQDLATATATYNSGAEALTMGNKTSACLLYTSDAADEMRTV